MSMNRIIRHPAVSIGAVILGILAGLYLRPVALACKPAGDIFLLLLNMCVLPILVTAIVSSVGRIVSDKARSFSVLRVLLCYMAAFCALELLALCVTSLLKPGALSAEAQDVLGELLMEAEQDMQRSTSTAGSQWDMLKKLIPSNVFDALSRGDSLQVLFASLAVGVAAGLVERSKERYGIQAGIVGPCGTLFTVMTSLLNAFMLLLPVGLFAMTASQIATIGMDIIMAMAQFVVCIYALCLLVVALGSALVAFRSRISFLRALLGVKDSLLIAFAARSSLAAMPVAISDVQRLGADRSLADVLVPLGMVVARFSMAMLYMATLVFAVQLYEVQHGGLQLVQGMALCLLASIAGIGSPAVVSLSLLSVIFVPLGVPHSAMTTLLLVIIAIIDPILTVASVHVNCALTVLLGSRNGRRHGNA